MPAPIGASSISAPAFRCATKASTSWRASSVKTAMRCVSAGGSEREQLPQAVTADPLGGLRRVAARVGRRDLVGPHARGLRRDGDALQLAAHAQLLDLHVVVLDHRAPNRR